MGRAPCCDKANVKKGPWSPEEDAKLKSYIQQFGTGGNWIALPQKIGLKRCGKSCRLRWLNYLRPNIKHGGFTEEEENIICSLYISIGSRWSIIAAQLPGRTDNDIKNYWNTRLKKKLMAKQRKEEEMMMKRESDQIFMVSQTPYQAVPYLSEMMYSQDVLLGSQEDQLSILLTKFKGRQSYNNNNNNNNDNNNNNNNNNNNPQFLSNGVNYQYTTTIQDQTYGNYNNNNNIQWANIEYDVINGEGLIMNNTCSTPQGKFPEEIEAYMSGNLLPFEGNDRSYSSADVGNSSTTTTSTSSLVNTPVSDFDVYHNGVLQKVVP